MFIVIKELLNAQISKDKLNSCHLNLLFGPGGCGKGKMREAIELMTSPPVGNSGIHTFGTSDLARHHIKIKSHLAEDFMKAKELEAQGKLFPDRPMSTAVAEELIHKINEGFTTFVIDGYPRNEHQMQEIIETGIPYTFYNIKLEEDVGIQRILKRAEESQNGQAKKVRVDDNIDTYKKRYKEYKDVWLGAYWRAVDSKFGQIIELHGADFIQKRLIEVVSHFIKVEPKIIRAMATRMHDKGDPVGQLVHSLTQVRDDHVSQLQYS